jgi:hypothetical protein
MGNLWVSSEECWIRDELKDAEKWFPRVSDRRLKEPIGSSYSNKTFIIIFMFIQVP